MNIFCNFMTAIRKFILSFLSIFVFFPVAAQLNLVMQHREWVDSVYSNPENLSEEKLLHEACMIIASQLQEEKAAALLDRLGDTLPAVAEYAAVLRKGDEDHLNLKARAALQAIADYAEKRFPDTPLAYGCRLSNLSAESVFEDKSEDFTKFIGRQEKKLGKNPEKERLGQLYLAKALRLAGNLIHSDCDDPSVYPEIFSLEKDVMKLYPIDSEEVSMVRADLYSYLALLKQLLRNDFAGFINHYRYGEIPGMGYMLVGDVKDYPCNSLQYYEKAGEIASKHLNPGHPYTVDLNHTATSFKLNFMNVDEKMLDDKKYNYDFIKAYYPFSSREVAMAQVLNYCHNLSFGLPDNDGPFVRSAMDKLERYFGTANPAYLDQLSSLAFASKMADPDDNYWTERYIEAAGEAGADRDGRLDLFLLQLNCVLYEQTPDAALEAIDGFTAKYKAGHSPDLRSTAIGRLLSGFYSSKLQNFQLAEELLDIAISDLKKVAGKDKKYALLIWSYLLDKTSTQVLSDYTRTDDVYKEALQTLDREDFDGKELVRYYILNNWADMMSLTKNYQGGMDLTRECLSLIPDSPDKVIENIGRLAEFGSNEGIDPAELNPFVDRAVSLIRKAMSDGYYGQINIGSLDRIVSYFAGEGRFDEALEMVGCQLDMYDRLYSDHNDYEYIRLKQSQASVFEDAGRLNEARRIRDDISILVDETFGTYPSAQLLDCLWEEYNNSNPRNPQNSWETMLKLNRIMNVSNSLFNVSGRNKQVYFSYLPMYLAEFIYLMTTYSIMQDEVRAGMDGWSEEQKSQYLETLETNKNNFRDIIEISEKLMGEFRDYDSNFVSNTYYNHLGNALANYYANVACDTIRALKMREELLVGITIPSHRLTSTIGMGWDYYNVGSLEKAEYYAEEASGQIKNIRGVSSLDRQNLAGLNFNIAIDNGEPRKALPHARELFALQKETLDGNFQLMTSKEQDRYLNENGDPAFYLSFLLKDMPEELSGEVYNATVYRTGMQLRSQKATREAIRCSTDPMVPLMLDSLQNLYAIIDGIDLYSYTDVSRYQEALGQFTSLSRRANRLEQRLLDATAHLRGNTVADVCWQQIRDSLAPGQAAIEFLFSNDRVMALVVRKDSDSPKAVALMPIEQLWNIMNAKEFKGSAARAKYLYGETGSSLYEGLWQPIEKELEGIERVYYSLPGMLSVLAFNAFITPEGDTLFDRYELMQLTTTAQLVFDHEKTVPSTLVMMGDILYSSDQKPLTPDSPGVRDVDTELSLLEEDTEKDTESERALVKSYFRHLPFTAIEIDGIAPLFPQEGVRGERRHEATESKLREMVASIPDILHLATHGYYVSGNEDLSKMPFFRKVGPGSMQRSGFALAGAEKTWRGTSDAPDDNDGIMTAAEIADMNLKGTQLVTLSACETALGDTSFEGVFGLQRGFKQAGVESLLVSLWSVSDNSTSLFMTTFYDYLLKGEDKPSAWRNAVKTVRESFPSPYHWAPFILLDGN